MTHREVDFDRLEQDISSEEEYTPKVLRRDAEDFAGIRDSVAMQAAEVYRDDLLDKGYTQEQAARMILERQQEVIAEMEADYLGEQQDGGKYLFGFERSKIPETETMSEVGRRLEDCGVQRVELSGVLEKYQELIAKDVEEMCVSYPELKGYIGNIRAVELPENVFACAGPCMDKNGYCAEIQVNKEIFSKEGLERRIAGLEMPNWKGETWLAGKGEDAILKHEIGHLLHLRMLSEEQGLAVGSFDKTALAAVQDQYNKNLIATQICYETFKEQGIEPKEWAKHVSIYGARDMGECFAEAISEYETRDHPRAFATEVYHKYQRRVHGNDYFSA